jgi:hypothetical protein
MGGRHDQISKFLRGKAGEFLDGINMIKRIGEAGDGEGFARRTAEG